MAISPKISTHRNYGITNHYQFELLLVASFKNILYRTVLKSPKKPIYICFKFTAKFNKMN